MPAQRHLDPRCAGIDRVLDQFLDRGGRAFDHLAGGDAVDQDRGKRADQGHGVARQLLLGIWLIQDRFAGRCQNMVVSGGDSLIIFDCDGVLVDSELIARRTELAALAALGHPISEAHFVRLALGRSRRDLNPLLEAEWGRALPEDYAIGIRATTLAAFRDSLRPVPRHRHRHCATGPHGWVRSGCRR